VRLHPWMIRYVAPDELDAVAAHAGLGLVDRWSDWRRTPFTAEDNAHVSVYEVDEQFRRPAVGFGTCIPE